MSKQMRRSGAKVKTGCATCKIRRIKCDEGKPSCLKCINTGRRCDGYTSLKKDFQVQIWSHRQAYGVEKAVPLVSGSDDNVRYLEFYHHCARLMLSRNFDKDFWSRITLQMAFTEPSVRHALIALGYLYSTETGSMKHARSKYASQRESAILLRHYNKSVRSLVDRIGEVSYSPEIGLVTCLLFVCMEFLRGNYHTAFTHLISGMTIIEEYQKKKRHDSATLASLPKSISTTFATASHHPSTLIEEELKPIFDRAMASALMYGVDVELHVSVSALSMQANQVLQFENIRDIQLSFHKLRNQSIFHIRDMLRHAYKSHVWAAASTEFAEQQTILASQRAWFDALNKYRHTHRLSIPENVECSAMLMYWYALNISTLCSLEVDEMAFDQHLPQFRIQLQHCRLVLDAMETEVTQYAAKFTFEICIIPALYFIAHRCRCPIVRRNALSMLRRNPPREGLWDAQQYALVTKRLIEMEEKEIDPVTGWPVARTRLWSIGINANMDQKGGFWASFTTVPMVLEERKDDERPRTLQEFFVL